MASTGRRRWVQVGAHQLVEMELNLEVANMIAQRGVWGSPGDPPLQYDALAETLDAVGLHAAANLQEGDCAYASHWFRVGDGQLDQD